MAKARRAQLRAPTSEYRDDEGNLLVLRGALSPGTRASYARIAAGEDLAPAATQEDAWHRSFEFLFERLVASWQIAGTPPITRQRELLARVRVASAAERDWIRDCLRRHCAEWFPDVKAP